MTDTTVTASAPADLTAGRSTRGTGLSVRQVAELAAAANAGDYAAAQALTSQDVRGPGMSELFAALSDIKHDGSGAPGNNLRTPAWLGELWSGRSYQRRYVPLFASAPLTAFTVKGFRWTTKPGGGTWSGNKTAIPSGTVATTAYEKSANKWAGGHDHAIEYRHFPNPEYWESYYRHMAEDYAKDSDEGFLDEVIAAATPVEVGTVPSGVPEGLVKIVDGALAVLDYGSPTFALLAPDLWREFILTPKDETLEYLSSSTGLEDGSLAGFKVMPAPALDPGQALVGIRDAIEFREVPGVPLRIEALNVANGGIDTALFGYWASVVNEAGAVVLVDDPAEEE